MSTTGQAPQVLRFGKFRNLPLAQVPDWYLTWALRECRQVSSGIRVAIANELTSRGLTPPAFKPPPAPPTSCEHCESSEIRYCWFQDSLGRRQIKKSCAACSRSLGFAPLLSPYTDWANAQSSNAPVLDVLIQCDQLGIELSNNGAAVDFATEDVRRRAPAELRRRLEQCRHDLAGLLPKCGVADRQDGPQL